MTATVLIVGLLRAIEAKSAKHFGETPNFFSLSAQIPTRADVDHARSRSRAGPDARLPIIAEWTLPTNMQLACMKPSGVLETRGFANGRQPNYLQLEAENYHWIGCECCKGTVWVPFKMLRERDGKRHDARPARRQDALG